MFLVLNQPLSEDGIGSPHGKPISERKLGNAVPPSDNNSCNLNTEDEERTKNKSLFVDAISTSNNSVTGLDWRQSHVAKDSCRNNSNTQGPSRLIKESLKQKIQARPSYVRGGQILQLQDKQKSLTVKQLIQARRSNGLGKQVLQIQDTQVDVQKDPSELVNKSMIQSIEDRPRTELRKQVLQMQNIQIDVKKEPSELVNEYMLQSIEDGHRSELGKQVLQMHKQVNVQKDPSEFVMESMIQSTEDRPRNDIGEQDLQMKDMQVDVKKEPSELVNESVNVQKDPSELIKESMAQSTEDRLRNMLREQDLQMQDKQVNVQQDPSEFVMDSMIQSTVDGPRNDIGEQDLQMHKQVNVKNNPFEFVMESNGQSADNGKGNVLGEQDILMQDRMKTVQMDTSQNLDRHEKQHEKQQPFISSNPIWASTWLFGSERRLQHYFGVSQKELLTSQTKLGAAYREIIKQKRGDLETMNQKQTYSEIRSGNQADNVETSVEQDSKTEEENENPLNESSEDGQLSDDKLTSPSPKKRRKKRVHQVYDYTCDTCNSKFPCLGKLYEHIKKRHIFRGMYKCNFCPKEYFSQEGRIYHERIHTGETPFQCDECETKFRTKSALELHKIDEHGHDKPFLCDICGISFRPKSYIKHIAAHEVKEKTIECDKCCKKFATNRAMRSHMKKTHQTVLCDVCSETFESKMELKRHMMTHNKKAFQCDQCEASFDQKCNLTKHKVIHSGLKPYRCHICDYSQAHRSNLNKHLRTAHNLTPKSEGWLGMKRPKKEKSQDL